MAIIGTEALETALKTMAEGMTPAQEAGLSDLCARYHVTYDPADYRPAFDLPEGYVAGWAGGHAIQSTRPTIYVGCSPEGAISS